MKQSFVLSQMPKNRDEWTTIGDVIERFVSDVIPLRQSGDIEALSLGVFCRHPIGLVDINNSDLCGYRDQRLREVKRVDIADLRFHDLRHEAVSRFLRRG